MDEKKQIQFNKDMIQMNPTKKNFYTHRDAGNVFLWSFIACYAIAFLITIIAVGVITGMGGTAETATENLAFRVISSIITPLTFVGVFFIYNKFSKISLNAAKVKFNLKWHTVLLIIAISLVCVFGLQYAITGIDRGLSALGYKFSSINLPLDNVGWYFANIIILALLPAIGEELIYRGIIFNGLRRNVSDKAAVLISAALFTLMHGGLEQFVYPFILGIFFGWLVLRTGSTLSSIILHFCNNALVITLSFIENMTGFDFMPKQNWLFWTLAVLLFIVVFVIMFLIDKFYFKKKSKLDIEKATTIEQKQAEGKCPNISLILGIIVMGLIFIANTVTSFIEIPITPAS